MSVPFDSATWRKCRIRAGVLALSDVFSSPVNYIDAGKGIRVDDVQIPGRTWCGAPGAAILVEPNDCPVLWGTVDDGETFVLLFPNEIEEVLE